MMRGDRGEGDRNEDGARRSDRASERPKVEELLQVGAGDKHREAGGACDRRGWGYMQDQKPA
jgi:hypothetical protein